MKLSKDTKHLLNIGVVLRQTNGIEYTITDIVNNGRYTNITTISSESGTHIYGMPVSHYYGLEIKEL